MTNRLKVLLAALFLAITFAAFNAYGADIDAGPTGPDYCYAERPCYEGEGDKKKEVARVSCYVTGPGCFAEIVGEGVICEGYNAGGQWDRAYSSCDAI